jgi:dTDP-4-amino-4,6-dideoxygalactose transaminase
MASEDMPLITIPFNRPYTAGKEYDYIRQAIDNGHVSGDGPFTRRCQEYLERRLQGSKVLLTTSCTDALEMCALLMKLEPGDEVVLPSFTFVSTVNAFVLHGARPVFADIRPDTLNIDERQLGSLITERTRAVVVVHYAGVGCAMDAILDTANSRGIPVIEDNAHGLFGSFRGKALGTFGALATLSFHETKNISCGEGGAVVINDPAYIERAEIVREKGTNRSRFFRGQVDKYTWVDRGSSYLPSDMLAAFLYAQLEAAEDIQARRCRIWHTYNQALAEWCGERDIRMPHSPEECNQSYHMFYLLLNSLEQRQALIAHLRGRGILGVFHYVPLHLSEMGRQFGGHPGMCPVTEDLSDRLIRLPFYNGMTVEEQRRVIDAVREFRGV